MLRTILIGLDGSEYSAGALELGLKWAREFDALLVGLGIIDEPAILDSEMVPLGADAYKEHRNEVRLQRARHRVEQFLEQFTLRCTRAGVASKVLEDVGEPYEQIVHEAQRYDLILLGQLTHFHFATQEGPCDTLEQVLRNTPRPVVIGPPQPASGAAVLVAFDGSLQAARAVQAFQVSGLARLGPVHVVTVGADHVEAHRHADRAIEFLRFHEVTAQPHVVSPSSSIGETLLEQARQLDAGLLVMGAYGQPTLREFFLGSATRTILTKSPVPLFLYH